MRRVREPYFCRCRQGAYAPLPIPAYALTTSPSNAASSPKRSTSAPTRA
jgi:hypothetical protein